MARSQHRSLRKTSGGRYRTSRGKRKHELGGFPALTKLSPEKSCRVIRKIGGSLKRALLSGNQISITDKKGKTTKTEMVNVVENPANPNLVRRNILTKGAIVETKLGKVKVTNRPGQEGCVSGVLI